MRRIKNQLISSIISASERPDNTYHDENSMGVTFLNNTGPTCHIEEIDETNTTTVSLLKEALSKCLDLPDWINNNHIMLYFKGHLLFNDDATL